jgi:hypothetical protein
MTVESPKLPSGALQASIKRVGEAHNAIKAQIVAHAEEEQASRQKTHDALHATNVMQHKS